MAQSIVVLPKGCAPEETCGLCVPQFLAEPLEANRTLGVFFSRGLVSPSVAALQKVVAFCAVCSMQPVQHLFAPALRDTCAYVPAGSLAASVPVLGFSFPTSLLLAWDAGAVSCCVVPWLTWTPLKCPIVLCCGWLHTPLHFFGWLGMPVWCCVVPCPV